MTANTYAVAGKPITGGGSRSVGIYLSAAIPKRFNNNNKLLISITNVPYAICLADEK